jgi:hypothetical protein
MEIFEEKLKEVLTSKFPGAELLLDEPFDGKHGGYLVWDGFSEEEIIDRLTKVWKTLRKRFRTKDLRKISFIFAMTPEELLAMRERDRW